MYDLVVVLYVDWVIFFVDGVFVGYFDGGIL